MRQGQYNAAIDIYQKCLEKVTIKDYSEQYARIHLQLGYNYGLLSEKENKIQNLQKSIDSFNEALKKFTFDNYPVEYVTGKHQLGWNYLDLSEFTNKQENLEKSIDAFSSSDKGLIEILENKQVLGHVRILDFQGLGYVTQEEYNTKVPDFGVAYVSPANNVYTQLGLADAYHDLAVLTKNSSYYNKSQESLNNAYMTRVSFDENALAISEKSDLSAYGVVKFHEGRDIEGFDNQIRAYEEALQISSLSTEKFAEIQYGMGTSYYQENPNNVTNIEKSIYHYKLALANTDKNHPFKYGKILNKLGISYASLGFFKDREENFEKAKNAFNTYLTIYTFEYPIPFAETHRDLAVLYSYYGNVKNNRTNYQIAQDSFDIAKVNDFFGNFSTYESFLNLYSLN